MIMIIAMIYSFFILCDIWSTIENYFQKILSLPPPSEKIQSPLKNSKIASPLLFANIEKFLTPFSPSPPPPAESGDDTVNTFIISFALS